MEANWQKLNNPLLGALSTLDDLIGNIETREPGSIPNLRVGDQIVIASDYGGQHSASRFDVISMIFVDIEQCTEWEQGRRTIRSKYLRDSRRMAFKNLNDRQRVRSLLPFLSAADKLAGFVVTIGIDKTINSLFTHDPNISAKNYNYKPPHF